MKLNSRIRNVMREKKSNLCVSLDFTKTQKILEVLDMIKDYVVMIKLHCDIITDFNLDFTKLLVSICEKNNIFILEDRKFADIGYIFQQQFTQGLHKISSWCHLITMHSLLGEGPILEFQNCAANHNQGILLIAHLSNQNNLIDSNYEQNTLALAKKYPEQVIGFICQNQISEDSFLHFTPGVNRHMTQDSNDQRYVSPEKAIQKGTDIIIVGRGITQNQDIKLECQIYKNICWDLYIKNKKLK